MDVKVTCLLFLYFITVKCDCPDGFEKHDDSCYNFPRIQGTWAQASVYCNAINSQLASIESQVEESFLEGYLQNYGKSYDPRKFWVGGTDILHEGEWTWVKTGRNISAGYTHWSPGQPDNGDSDENCLELEADTHWEWNDESCEHMKHFICEKSIFGDDIMPVG